MGFFDKIKEGLRKTRENISGQINSMLNSFTKIDEELFEELEELLIMGDVGMPTAERICTELRARIKKEGVTDPKLIQGMLQDIVAEMLRGGDELHIGTKPSVVLVIGVNGVGENHDDWQNCLQTEKRRKAGYSRRRGYFPGGCHRTA